MMRSKDHVNSVSKALLINKQLILEEKKEPCKQFTLSSSEELKSESTLSEPKPLNEVDELPDLPYNLKKPSRQEASTNILSFLNR